jgi:hypothetical protein
MTINTITFERKDGNEVYTEKLTLPKNTVLDEKFYHSVRNMLLDIVFSQHKSEISRKQAEAITEPIFNPIV